MFSCYMATQKRLKAKSTLHNRCIGIEVLDIGNTQVKHKYLINCTEVQYLSKCT